jgi:hypothetical protein
MIFAGATHRMSMFVCERKPDNVITGYLPRFGDAIEQWITTPDKMLKNRKIS